MGADLGHPAVVHHHDPVGPGRGGEPVRDHDGRAAAGQPVGGRQHGRFRGRIERRRRLVEQQDVRVDQLGPGQRDQLPLTGGQVAAAFLDLVVESAGQRRRSSPMAPTARAAASTSASVASGRP